MKETSEKSELFSRRRILKGSVMLLVGGIAGRISSAFGTQEQAADKALSLPWKWVRLDPLEAGRRAYKFYLTRKG